MMLRQLVKVTDAYPLTEADIALITTASSLHDIGKIRIPEEILNKPGRLTDEEFKIMKTHSELGAAIIKDMDFPQNHPLVHTAWEIYRWYRLLMFMMHLQVKDAIRKLLIMTQRFK